MTEMARLNEKTVPDNYEEILRQHFEPKFNPSSGDTNAGETKTPNIGVLDLFRTTNMRAKTLIITFIWFANTCVYVGLSYYAPALGGDEIWNFFLAGAVELPTYLFLWPGLSCIGRRWILCASMLVGGLACLFTFLVQEDQITMLSLYCIGKMGISSAFVVLPLAASELYPTVVRGLGMSISSVIGMIGPIVIPIINYMVINYERLIKWWPLLYRDIFFFQIAICYRIQGSNMLVLPLIIMGCLLTLGGIASLFLPETMNKPLPQTIEDGENVPLSNPFSCFCFRRDQRSATELKTINK